jgi:hypothetical protein
MKKKDLKAKFTKMSSIVILRKMVNGQIKKSEALAAAEVFMGRTSTPHKRSTDAFQKALEDATDLLKARIAAKSQKEVSGPKELITPPVSKSSKMTKTQLKAKIKKMSTAAMLRKAIKGYMGATEGRILADIISLRIPSPSSQAN